MDVKKQLEDILDDPLLKVSYNEAKLFDIPEDMRNVIKKRIESDHVATRKLCDEFDQFRPLFNQVQSDLKSGRRSLIRTTKLSNFTAGNFYVVSGELIYIDKVGVMSEGKKGHYKDARTRCIYENGTESDIWIQTLRKSVYLDGYAVTQTQEQQNDALFALTEGDKTTGYVYVLRSLSKNPIIAEQKDLYKIGFTTQSVEERIANAVNEPTYLMAPVQIMLTAQIVNMNSHIFESLVHQIFDQVQYQVSVYDSEGVEHVPSEWYVAPLGIIESVIKKIADRSITAYTYNAEQQCLEKRIIRNSSTFNTTGLKVLTLTIKQEFFDEILSGQKTIEYRELKQTTLNKYTYIDEADGKRYLRRYDVLRLAVGYSTNRETALVQVVDTTYNEGLVEYHLGAILEHVKKPE